MPRYSERQVEMTLIYEIIAQKKEEQGVTIAPQKVTDYIAQSVYDYLDKLDSNVINIIAKTPLKVESKKMGKYNRYEVSGKPIMIELADGVRKIPVSLIVYEDKQGIKESWYVAQDIKRNRMLIRQLVTDYEVEMA